MKTTARVVFGFCIAERRTKLMVSDNHPLKAHLYKLNGCRYIEIVCKVDIHLKGNIKKWNKNEERTRTTFSARFN